MADEEEYPEEGNTGALGAMGSAIGAGVRGTGSAIRNTSGEKIKKIMRIANAVNGLLVMTAGVVLLASIGSCESEGTTEGYGSGGEADDRRLDEDSGETKVKKIKDEACPLIAMGTIGFYSVVFGFLLTAFELRWGEKYRAQLYKYFGFLFGYFGRMMFILFLATLCLALPSGIKNNWVGYTVGALTLCNGFFNMYVIYNHPDIRAGIKAKKQQRKGKKGGGGGGSDPEAGRSHTNSTETYNNPYSPSAGGGAMPASRGARGMMQPSDHPAYSTPAMAPAPAPAAPGNAFDDDNPFADDSVTGAM